MSDKSQANKLGAILLSKGLALSAAMIKPGWFVIFWAFLTLSTRSSDTFYDNVMYGIVVPTCGLQMDKI